MAETVIDYKEEGAMFAYLIGFVALILWVLGEPLVDLWNYVILLMSEHITKIRIFVYLASILSVLLVGFAFLFTYARYGKWYTLYLFVVAHILDYWLSGNNMLLKIIFTTIKSGFLWLFGDIS